MGEAIKNTVRLFKIGILGFILGLTLFYPTNAFAQPRPTVELNVTRNPTALGELTNFTASLDTVYNYTPSYNFYLGNGDSTGWRQNPQFRYEFNNPGSYEAYVRVRPFANSNLVIESETVTVTIEGQASILLGASNLLIRVNEPISFNAQLDTQLPEMQYQFNFGVNGPTETSSSPNITHSFSNPGRYLVSVDATTVNGEFSLESNSLQVTVVELNLATDKEVILEGERVRLIGSLNPVLNNAIYEFEIGDTTISRQQPQLDYTFENAGEYQVSFTASVFNRSVSSEPDVITVHSIPDLVLDVSANEAKTGDQIQFSTTGIPPELPVEYNFDFGDGSNSDWVKNSQVTHSYADEGPYEVIVEARFASGQVLNSNTLNIVIEGGFPYWIIIVAGLVVLAIVGYLLVNPPKIGNGKGNATIPKGSASIKPHIDPGKQELAPNSTLDIGQEIRLKPVKDQGVQSMEATDNLIKEERKL